MKTKTLALGLVFLLVAGGSITYWCWTRTPAYSLKQIERAFRTHDVALFENHVDTESVSSRLIDDMMAHALNESEQKTGAEGLGTALAAGMIQLMKPRLVGAVKEQAVRFIEEGSFESENQEAPESDSERITLHGISKKIGAGKSSFTGVKFTKTQGKIAIMGLGFHNDQLDADQILELKLRDMGNHWRLVEFSNVPDLLEETAELEAARLAKINGPVLQQISEAVEVNYFRKNARSDRWGISKNVDLDLSVRNTSSRAIAGFSANLRIFDPTGQLVKEISVRDEDPIAPWEYGGGVWSVDVNMFDAAENRLYELPSEEIQFDIEFTRVIFDDGIELKVFKSLDETAHQK